MKKILLSVILLPILISAQEVNKTIIEEDSGKPMLIGLCNRSAFADTSFSWWFDSEYNNYEANKNDLDTIASGLLNVKIKIALGSWCSDSRREVPRLLKVLDELKFDPANLEMICVDRDKKAEGTEVDLLDIKFVPTIIFYSEEKEIGRIVEAPQTTLEGDIKNILLNKTP